MKKICKFICVMLVLMLIVGQAKTVPASMKKVKVEIVKVNKKFIKFKVTNNRKKMIGPSARFVLKKKIDNKWETVELDKYAGFIKTFGVWPKTSRKIKYKWKTYIGENLSSGKYKITFIEKTRRFTIKE